MATLLHSPTALSGDRSGNMSPTTQSKGLLSGLKHKMSRKNSKGSTEPTESTFRTPMEISTQRSINQTPLGTNSQATRRPGGRSTSNQVHDPPPMYTPSPVSPTNPVAELSSPAMAELPSPSSPHAAAVAPTPLNTADDRYAFLSTFDTVFLIDDSGSMAGRSWRETGGALETITPICTAHDADGIDVYFLNEPDKPNYRGIRDANTVRQIFQTVKPQYGTPTGQRLNQILRPYLARAQADLEATKPLNVIVITDGEPSDDVESVIIDAARKLDRLDAPAWQVGIQFFQVGNEPGAREHLRQLDDELADLAGGEALRDIVDTVPFTGQDREPLSGEGILKVVLGAVNRRLDRRRSTELYRR